MARYFLKLAYNGAPFHGWQKQRGNIPTVQAEIERAFSIILQQKVNITGCGRTDTGVHAKEFFAHFDFDVLPKKFQYSLNGILPNKIVIYDIIKLHDDAHARFDATSRTYQYYVHQNKNPFSGDLSYFVPGSLDIDAMNNAAKLLLETEDFTSFSKLHSDAYTNICDVTYAKWVKKENDTLLFEITANRFLRNMVRAVVGTLIDVGKHKIDFNDFEEIILSKNRSNAGKSVDGGALFLSKITYPYME